MYNRWVENSLINALKTRRIVILSGSRQCGKTTLAKMLINNNCVYRTLDDIALFKAAQNDPHGFVKNSPNKTMIIDEIQRVPELLTAIKKAVDENTRYAQYLITGSVNIQTLPTVKESLAGRVKKRRLRPLTQGEILKKKPQFLYRLQNNEFTNNTKYDKETIMNLIFKGGFPEPLALKDKHDIKSWYKDYINTIIEYDLKDIANIKRQEILKKLIEVISSYSSKFIDKTKITSALGISSQTLNSYLCVLKNTYIIDQLYPWIKTDYERINKQSKYYITDTGLMNSVLNWNFDNVFLDADRSGKIFETFAYTQIAPQVELEDDTYSLYHYRDREQREIDFIIHSEDKIYGIEIKAGSNMSSNYFKHLKWFKNNLTNGKDFIGIVLYTGESALSFGDGLYAVPMNNLWE